MPLTPAPQVPPGEKYSPEDFHHRWIANSDKLSILAIERKSYEFSWGREFFDSVLSCRSVIGKCVQFHGNSNEPLGYMIYDLGKESIRLLNLAVNPIHRRRGVGSSLLTSLQSKIAGEKFPRRIRILATVEEHNDAAIALLVNSGFIGVSLTDSSLSRMSPTALQKLHCNPHPDADAIAPVFINFLYASPHILNRILQEQQACYSYGRTTHV